MKGAATYNNKCVQETQHREEEALQVKVKKRVY